MLTIATMILVSSIGIIVGVLIGAIGIGGVLLVPMLTYGLDLGIHVAIATAMFAYLFSGAVGAVEYARRGSIQWRMALWLCLGGMPGAYLGALAVWLTPGAILEGIIGLLVFLSGLQALRPQAEDIGARDSLAPALLLVIGIATGFASSITGTGGPLVLVPILIWLKVSGLTAVGLSQIIQIPIALLATGGNQAFGHIEFELGFGIAVMLAVGVFIGARVAHRVSRETLRRLIAFALLLVGAAMLTRIGAGLS